MMKTGPWASKVITSSLAEMPVSTYLISLHISLNAIVTMHCGSLSYCITGMKDFLKGLKHINVSMEYLAALRVILGKFNPRSKRPR